MSHAMPSCLEAEKELHSQEQDNGADNKGEDIQEYTFPRLRVIRLWLHERTLHECKQV